MLVIRRGYERRARVAWETTRFATYNIMSTGMADLEKAGIHKQSDILHLPWIDDKESPEEEEITPEEIERLRALMRKEQAELEKKNQGE